MNWPSSLLAGFTGTLVLTSLEAGAQQMRLTRMSVPYLLGTAVTSQRDRAKAIGFFLHLFNGQIFALLYVALFQVIGRADALRGAVIGFVHGVIVLLIGLPMLSHLHPRIASEHQGPTEVRQIEPPGPFALHYGISTPLAVIVSHIVFGVVLGALYRP